MAGDSNLHPSGRISELLELADEQGSVTAGEIVDVVGVEEFRIEYDGEWSVGRD